MAGNQSAPSWLVQAVGAGGFEDWTPSLDVPELHRPRKRPANLPGTGRVAAVLMLIYPAGSATETESHSIDNCLLLLTKRQSTLSKHASQISFPGGQLDADETLEQAAIREANEEVGVVPAQVQILGALNPVYIPPSDFTVTPFVGWTHSRPQFTLSEQEVECTLEPAIDYLLNPAHQIIGEIESSNGLISVPLYQFQQHKIWGATAIMVAELIDRLRAQQA